LTEDRVDIKMPTGEIYKEVAVATFPEDDDGIVPVPKALYEESSVDPRPD
jgi:hypothetical protein